MALTVTKSTEAFSNSTKSNLAVQLVTSSDFTCSTIATIQESADNVNWQDITDGNGGVLELEVNAASSAYMLKTNIAFARYTRVSASSGISGGEIRVNVTYK